MSVCCDLKPTNTFRGLETQRSMRPSRARCRNQRCRALNPKFNLERCGLCVRPGVDFCHHHVAKCTGPNAIWPTVDKLMIPSVIGRGLRVGPSTLGPDAGTGVFATRYFKNKDLVTFYDGEVFSMAPQSPMSREYRDTPRSSHFLSIRGEGAFAIDGVRERIRDNVYDLQGRGAGSMMNSMRPGNTQCVIMQNLPITLRTSQELWPGGDGQMSVPSVYFFATSDIAPGDELFWNYIARESRPGDDTLPMHLRA